MRDYDVVIAGFGPTGALAANLLGKYGIRTLVVDPQPAIYDIPRGVHFDGETMRIFQSVGLADAIFAQSACNKSLNFVNSRGLSLMRVELDGLPQTTGWPASIFFRQPLVEKHLRDHLSHFDSVTENPGWALRELMQDEDGVELTLQDVESGEAKKIRAAYLIGADGADSTVRQLLDIPLEDMQCDEPWLVVDWELEPDITFNHDVYQFCDPARPGTLVPCAGQHIRWEFMINPGDDYDAMEEEDAVRAMMAPYLHHLSPHIRPDQGQILRSKVYQFHGLLAERMRAGRVFLMGDAAHQMPPFLGQGMCAGLRDAENLIWKLAGVLGGRYEAHILSSYHSERHAHVRAVIKQAVKIGEIIQTRNRLKAIMRDTFLRLGKLLPKLLSGIEFGQTWRLGSGLFSGDPASGRQIPQPLVHHPNTPDKTEKLDAFLPEGFCLLALHNTGKADFQRVSDAYPQLDCKILVLGDDLVETDGLLSVMAGQHRLSGFLLRPDRQIYAALKEGGPPLPHQLEEHLATLSQHLFANGKKLPAE
ncbi:MAG: bifunctional 3-(3-hydroxy-phenyl)propionate/3-hydroxycinnamic acid hydroxylase [Parvularculales bacterium]